MPLDTARAACTGTTDPEVFFDRAQQATAKRICYGCPIADDCLEMALGVELSQYLAAVVNGGGATYKPYGVYGGWTAGERLSLIYRRAQKMLGEDVA